MVCASEFTSKVSQAFASRQDSGEQPEVDKNQVSGDFSKLNPYLSTGAEQLHPRVLRGQDDVTVRPVCTIMRSHGDCGSSLTTGRKQMLHVPFNKA